MTTDLQFSETLKGSFAWGQVDPRSGALEGKQAGIDFGFNGTIVMDDIDAFIGDPAHAASFTGTYMGNLFESQGKPAPKLLRGVFNFMAPGPGAPRLMIHEHTLQSGNEIYHLHGTKYLDHNDPLADDVVADLTTLYSTLRDDHGRVVAAGVLHFPMILFPELVASFHSTHGDGFVAKMKFLKLFLREEIYVLLTGFRKPTTPPNVRRRLAKPSASRKASYDVVVIGSGYGGGVAAARLASFVKDGNKKSVCLLERGRELVAGEFPHEPWEMALELRTPISPNGLFEYHDLSAIETVVGNGLGGTSLINANVMLRAEPGVFKEAPWPRGLPDLAPYYARAEAMIQPSPTPAPPVKSLVLLESTQNLARANGEPAPPVDLVPLAINFKESVTRADTGNTQTACVNCGGCVSGCNVTAKSTVDQNYLSVAELAGAEIFVQTEVLGIAKLPAGGYEIHVLDRANGQASTIAATQVIVSAGVLGTFRILKSSERNHHLQVPAALGTRFSGNGDILGFGYDTREPCEPSFGPTITTRVRYCTDPDQTKHFILEDGGIPPALTAVIRAALPFVKHTDAPESGFLHHVGEWLRTQADFVGLVGVGALKRSQLYFGMGSESTSGTLELAADGTLSCDWPGVANQGFAQRIDDAMSHLTFAIGGAYVKNPEPRSFLREKLITAHPLGGCPMGDDPTTSAVDALGRLRGHEGGIYVADGSIIPTPIGLNPALTIAALAEHIVENIQAGW